MDEIEIIEHIPLKEKKPVVITGLTGPGLVANTSAKHVIKEMGLKLRVEFRSKIIPPMILYQNGGLLNPIRIYSDDEGKLIFIICDTPLDTESAWQIGEKIIKYLADLNVREYVLVESMPFQIQSGNRVVFGFGSPSRDVSSQGVSPIAEGGISGLNAVIVDYAAKNKTPWLTLIASTSASAMIDYGGALAIVTVLNKMFDLDVDVSFLEKTTNLTSRPIEESKKKGGVLDFLRR
jgi:predicted ATP-grasp superfamily ATP-dependent carboligase